MMTQTIDIDVLVENEWYAVRFSGEIPEVAYHGALFHLTEEHKGPQIELSLDQQDRLLEAVALRYLDITLRDLLPENKDTGGYRGLKRSFINWQRFLLFCERYSIDSEVYRKMIAAALTDLLQHENCLMEKGEPVGEFNCSLGELLSFMDIVGLNPADLPASLRNCCLG
jgi:hypothetical protein